MAEDDDDCGSIFTMVDVGELCALSALLLELVLPLVVVLVAVDLMVDVACDV